MITTLQKMDKSGPDCEDRYKEIIAKETEKAATAPRQSSSDAKAKKPHRNKEIKPSRRSGPSRSATSEALDFFDDEISAFMSPNHSDSEPQLLPSLPKPIESDFDDDDSDFDLPDASVLFKPKAKPQPQPQPKPWRTKRSIFSDSDE
jgi:ATP-dependent DNA helicase MPH1